ncbi:MAG: hypothetical protein M3P85_07590 [Actinomycetota bacterium]|nr:hypothetical protein [Actinomycetota bacterium]
MSTSRWRAPPAPGVLPAIDQSLGHNGRIHVVRATAAAPPAAGGPGEAGIDQGGDQ